MVGTTDGVVAEDVIGNSIKIRELRVIKYSQNRTRNSIDKYLQEIGKTPLLTPEEEIELSQRIKKGDQEAFEKLASANLLFVVSVAKMYQNKGLSLDDLINEGNLGLLRAAKRFDETRGFKFISYAVWWIRQAILQALAEQPRVVRLPLNRINGLYKIGKVYSSLEQEYEREPSAKEIAKELDMTDIEVEDTLKISRQHLSVDSPFKNNETSSLLDVLHNENQSQPDADLLDESLKIEIERALSTLGKREAEIVRLYFGLNGHGYTNYRKSLV